jgi:hypothetical protein
MDLINDAERYVKNLFLANKNELLLFHNLFYIKKTIEFADQICEMENVTPIEREDILVSAWFFSTGFLFDYIDYKRYGIKVAHEFLEEKKVEAQRIEHILMIIESVLHNIQQENKCSEILYDASEFYLADDDFLLWVKYHRQERNYFLTPKLTKRSFWQTAQNFMQEHKYQTKSAIQLFGEYKESNLLNIKYFLSHELKKQLPVDNRMLINDLKEEIRIIDQKVEKRLSSSRGFDTLYRITARNQITLSGLADNKSSILITLNTLIVSAVITFVLVNHSELKFLMLPSFMAIAFSVVSVTFAILATRPQIKPGTFKMEEFYNKKVDLLFYGNYYKMEYEEYERAMMDMLKDQDLLLSSLNRDQFALGKILARKFNYLNYSFTVFLFGFIISSSTFAIVLFFFKQNGGF